MPNRVLSASLAAAVLVALACQATAADPKDVVTVSGNHLLRDGKPWIPHGLNLVAFESDPTERVSKSVFDNAYNAYSPGEFARLKAWGADTVRIQVAQPGVDPLNPNHQFDRTFVATVASAVRAARAVGLAVIVSIQDEAISGQPAPLPGLPTQGTLCAWLELAPLLNDDRGILYELFNEPRIADGNPNPAAPTAVAWAAWKLTMATVISAIRETGSQNVVLADGLDFAETLDGAPALPDSRNQVAYAVHPYFDYDIVGPAVWKARFGNFAATAPVVATEWNTPSTGRCNASTPYDALALLDFLQVHGIGLIAYAYDFVLADFGAVVTALDNGVPNPPTTFVGQTCFTNPPPKTGSTLSAKFGPGKTIQTWFRTGSVPATPQ